MFTPCSLAHYEEWCHFLRSAWRICSAWNFFTKTDIWYMYTHACTLASTHTHTYARTRARNIESQHQEPYDWMIHETHKSYPPPIIIKYGQVLLSYSVNDEPLIQATHKTRPHDKFHGEFVDNIVTYCMVLCWPVQSTKIIDQTPPLLQ